MNINLFPRQVECLDVLKGVMYVLFGGARGGGKAAPTDEPVCTPKGWKPIGHLMIGDTVTDPVTGGSTKVIAMHPQGVQDIYRVTCRDGSTTRVVGEHLWAYRLSGHHKPRTKCATQREFAKDVLGATVPDDRWTNWRIGTTHEIQRLLASGKSVRIPLTEPILFTANGRTGTGAVAPYLLGLYLGDGCHNGYNITSADDEIRNYLLANGFVGVPSTCSRSSDGKPLAYSPHGEARKAIKRWCANHGLSGKRAHEKFIPLYVFTAPIEYRLSFLQGLMDTDGYCDGRGRCSFCSTSLELAEGVSALVRGLGGMAKTRQRRPYYTDADGNKVNGRTAYDVRIWMRKTSALFRLTRKREACTDSWNGGHELTHEIVKIERVGQQEAVCITVDSPYGLYVTNDYIVTHNSFLSRAYLVMRAVKYPNTRHLIVRKSFPELERNHIMGFKQEYPLMTYNVSRHLFTLPNGSTIECGFCESEKDLQKWQGAEFATIVLDEAQFHAREIFEFFKTILRTSSATGIVPRMLLTGNPGGHMWLKQAFIDGIIARGERAEDFAFVKSLVTDNPALMKADPEYVERLKSLPPALRAAFLEGDWNAIIGAFFNLAPEMEEDPFEIEEGHCRGNLFIAIDHGIRHSTSSGMAYLDQQGHAHDLFSYMGTGFDAATHAKELVDRIQAFPWTHGVAPYKAWYDPSMAIQSRLNAQMVSSPLMEYQRVFAENGMGQVIWEAANNNRVFGAQIMQQYFQGNGVPLYRIWAPYNRDFRALMAQIMCDPNNAETYLKEETPADDLADRVRYLCIGLHGESMLRKTKHESRIKLQSRRAAQTADWYTV